MQSKCAWLLVFISFLLTNIVAFLDEGIRTFDYLTRPGDWIALIIYTIFFLCIPLAIFFLLKRDEKHRFLYSLFGFVPVLLLILMQLR